jgi:hypothetical protein
VLLVHLAVIVRLASIVQDHLVVATHPLEMPDASDHAQDLHAEMPTTTIIGVGARHHPEVILVHHLVVRHRQSIQIVWALYLARLHIAKPRPETAPPATSNLLQDLGARGVATNDHRRLVLQEVSAVVKSRLLVPQVVLRQLNPGARQVASTVLVETLPILRCVVVRV